MKRVFPLLLFFFCASCNESAKQSRGEPASTKYLDSLHLNTTTVDIGFFSDYSKSSIQVTTGEISRQSFIDSTFRFIGDRTEKNCALPFLAPDGTITFYKEHLPITSFYFVLGDSCKGFYDGLIDNASNYSITSLGKSKLSEYKRNLLPR
jgi:hypothetical protein